jgi:hypothetical protein
MRIVLRLIAGFTLLSLIGTFIFVLQFWLRGGILPLLQTGPFGFLTVLGWVITIVVGPPAILLLWRLNDGGRRASVLFWASIFLYYLLTLVFFRTPSTRYGTILWSIVGSIIAMALLVSRQARLACGRSKPAVTE